MVVYMKDNIETKFLNFIPALNDYYINDIKINDSCFTRNRKTNPCMLLLQMFSQKGQTQHSELLNFYKDIDKPLDISTVGFYKARMNFNPEAIKLMSNDFIYQKMYDDEDESIVKLNGYIVTAIDGSDIILPNTFENQELYGQCKGVEGSNQPVLGKVSILYDCINKFILDSGIGRNKESERAFASTHLTTLKANLNNKTITTFDRGYYSARLMCQMIDNDQKFLFRLPAQSRRVEDW